MRERFLTEMPNRHAFAWSNLEELIKNNYDNGNSMKINALYRPILISMSAVPLKGFLDGNFGETFSIGQCSASNLMHANIIINIKIRIF